jgi:hypothetical protein
LAFLRQPVLVTSLSRNISFVNQAIFHDGFQILSSLEQPFGP